MSNLTIHPITSEEVEDAANLFLMSVNAYIGFDKTGLELAGAAHLILAMAVQEINERHEQTTSSEAASVEGTPGESGQIQGSGPQRGLAEGTEGHGEDVAGEATPDAPEKSQNKS